MAAKGNDNDDKHAKCATQRRQQSSISTRYLVRRLSFYILLSTALVDFYASKCDSMLHLTLWSCILHTLYFELPLNEATTLALFFHGPSFSGAHALFAMYLWTLYANPNMEFDLAPEGRAVWLVYVRAFWLHFGPVLLHWIDLASNREALQLIYKSATINTFLLYFWSSVGGYFAMGLSWEQVSGDASATYHIENMSEETYVNVSKALGVTACILSFLIGIKAQLLHE